MGIFAGIIILVVGVVLFNSFNKKEEPYNYYSEGVMPVKKNGVCMYIDENEKVIKNFLIMML